MSARIAQGGYTREPSAATAMMLIIIILGVSSGSVVPFGTSVFASHGHWIDRYTSVNDIPCCGPSDCFTMPMRLVHMNETFVTLDIKGTPVTIARESFHLSEDTSDYLCLKNMDKPIDTDNIRCAFIAVGS